MREYDTFVGVDGKEHRCLFPAGQDPILRAWERGEHDAHPTWSDSLFWQDVAEQEAQQIREAAKQAAKRKSNGSESQEGNSA